jgi:hypothetical protein
MRMRKDICSAQGFIAPPPGHLVWDDSYAVSQETRRATTTLRCFGFMKGRTKKRLDPLSLYRMAKYHCAQERT